MDGYKRHRYIVTLEVPEGYETEPPTKEKVESDLFDYFEERVTNEHFEEVLEDSSIMVDVDNEYGLPGWYK